MFHGYTITDTVLHSFRQWFWICLESAPGVPVKTGNSCFNEFRHLIKKKKKIQNFPSLDKMIQINVSFSAIDIGNVDKLVINYISLIKDCTKGTERKHLPMKIHVHLNLIMKHFSTFALLLLEFLCFVPLCSLFQREAKKELMSLSRNVSFRLYSSSCCKSDSELENNQLTITLNSNM